VTALGRMRRLALAAIVLLVAAATLVSFAESYRALYEWAARHGLAGVWADVWPLQVDVFIAVGELALFVALADGWNLRSRIAAWTVTSLGLAVSVAGNIGHVASADFASRATAAVPPLAAAAALAVGLGVLKRVVAVRPKAVEPADDGTPGAATAAAEQPVEPVSALTLAPVPSDALQAAEARLRATVAAGNPLSVNALQERFNLTRATARDLRAAVLAESNGSAE
jgi:hypothetical protein